MFHVSRLQSPKQNVKADMPLVKDTFEDPQPSIFFPIRSVNTHKNSLFICNIHECLRLFIGLEFQPYFPIVVLIFSNVPISAISKSEKHVGI